MNAGSFFNAPSPTASSTNYSTASKGPENFSSYNVASSGPENFSMPPQQQQTSQQLQPPAAVQNFTAASSGPEIFSNYNAASSGPENFSMPQQQQQPPHGGAGGGAHGAAGGGEDHFEYEGVALQTALNAFGNVASVAGSMAGLGFGGVRTVGMGSMGSVLGSVTPSKLVGGMASWPHRCGKQSGSCGTKECDAASRGGTNIE